MWGYGRAAILRNVAQYVSRTRWEMNYISFSRELWLNCNLRGRELCRWAAPFASMGASRINHVAMVDEKYMYWNSELAGTPSHHTDSILSASRHLGTICSPRHQYRDHLLRGSPRPSTVWSQIQEPLGPDVPRSTNPRYHLFPSPMPAAICSQMAIFGAAISDLGSIHRNQSSICRLCSCRPPSALKRRPIGGGQDAVAID